MKKLTQAAKLLRAAKVVIGSAASLCTEESENDYLVVSMEGLELELERMARSLVNEEKRRKPPQAAVAKSDKTPSRKRGSSDKDAASIIGGRSGL